jgi:hypothetical protein
LRAFKTKDMPASLFSNIFTSYIELPCKPMR